MRTSHCDDASEDPMESEETRPLVDRPNDTETKILPANCTKPELLAASCVESEVLAASCMELEVLAASYMESEVLAASYVEQVDNVDVASAVSPEEVSVQTVDPSDRWSDSLASLPLETVTSDIEPVAQCDALSEMYYTASSEVSLLSDTEIPERVNVDEESLDGKDDRKECVIAGHVAAMRERFESMTRTNTPCPDLMRSSSPSLDVFRNITPSPNPLG